MDKARTRPLMIDPTKKYWRAILVESVGEVNITCIMHDIPADNKAEAGLKATLRYIENNPEASFRVKQVDLEPYSKPIQVWK